MDEKVWREFCEDCGCPLEVCCKPKKPVVLVEWLEEEHSEQLRAIKNAVDRDTFDFVKTIFEDIITGVRKQFKVAEK